VCFILDNGKAFGASASSVVAKASGENEQSCTRKKKGKKGLCAQILQLCMGELVVVSVVETSTKDDESQENSGGAQPLFPRWQI